MVDPVLSDLPGMIDGAVETIAGLRIERDRLTEQVGALNERIDRLEQGRRSDRGKLERLEAIEIERAAVQRRLADLLEKLEVGGDAE